MDNIKGKNNTQLVAAVKERLRWYTMEASEEEFDADEVDALVNLLNTLEPIEANEHQDDEQILERFHAYVELREAKEPESGERAVKSKRAHKGLSALIKAHKFVAVAAAVLLVIIVAGGSMGAVNASQGKGFFFWLKRDKEGATMITSPKSMDDAVFFSADAVYEALEAVPQEYRGYLVTKEEIKELQDYELKNITVHKSESFCRIVECFADRAGEKNVYIEVFIYADKMTMSREAYLGKEVQLPESDDDLQVGTIVRENSNGEEENTIYFFEDNVQYCIEGDVGYEILEQIAEAYKTIKFK